MSGPEDSGRFDPDILNTDDPFEIDPANEPHLFSHGYSTSDAYDVYYSDPAFFPAAHPPADWLMVARVPGGEALCVPLAAPKSGDVSKARPIGVYKASAHLATMYDNDQTDDSV